LLEPQTLFDKIWNSHVIADLGDGWCLLHIDRHLLHDLSGPPALSRLASRELKVRNPELTFATPDHAISSATGRTGRTNPEGAMLWAELKRLAHEQAIRFFDVGEAGHGIVHVISPELGITLPGATLVCGDSHTCTNGGLGALAFGIGSSEITHTLATQTLRQRKPKKMRITLEGRRPHGISAKDIILYCASRIGSAGATGYAVEYAGSVVRALEIEERMTLCNLTVEMGAKIGMIGPDERTYDYLHGRPFAPIGKDFERALRSWRTLPTDEDAIFDQEIGFDVGSIAPMVSWGVSPDQTIAIDQVIPDIASAPDARTGAAWKAAQEYMGLEPGHAIQGTKIDWVFIGSCTNSRISDLRDAARIAKGRRVATHVTAWVVPGSELVKKQAEAEGLHAVFRDAGFEWREPGCSMCVAANGERIPPGARSVSTSNRNFVGRQGPRARTHLVSPAMAVAAAVQGEITDVRRYAS